MTLGVPNDSHRLSNERMRTRLGIYLLVDEGNSGDPQKIYDFAIAFGYLLEFAGKSPLLQHHALDTGLGGVKPDLTQKSPPWGLTFMVLEGALWTAKGEK